MTQLSREELLEVLRKARENRLPIYHPKITAENCPFTMMTTRHQWFIRTGDRNIGHYSSLKQAMQYAPMLCHRLVKEEKLSEEEKEGLFSLYIKCANLLTTMTPGATGDHASEMLAEINHTLWPA
ncbi:hypothetical protein [Neptuniibacter sp. QD37_11]|uniref:hypothetical protein n=1 Tax=Neptuniibacter sp. QD37_11 TaxID=3398209 RepID=UPI0039F507BB